MPKGVGVLIRSRGEGGDPNGTFALFSGTTVTDATITVDAPVGFSMLSWPYNSTTANWTNSLSQASGHGTNDVTVSDAIWLYRNGQFTRMILMTNGWYYDFPNSGRVTEPMNPGEGFFYHNKQGGFSWIVHKPAL